MQLNFNKKNVRIIVPRGGNSNDGFAEKQLKKYLDMLLSANVAIEEENEVSQSGIFVGETAYTQKLFGDRLNSLPEDGFIIKVEDDSIFLSGKDTVYSTAGTIYAVYEFLERFFGVRFFAWDEEYLPDIKMGGIDLADVDIECAPSFTIRQYLAASTRKYSDYCAKMRIKDAYCGNVPGGTIYPLWAKSDGNYGQGHNSFEYVPVEEYKETHPEWYDLEHQQLCYSQFESTKPIIEGLKKRIAERPYSKFFAFSQNDTDTPCQCEKCRASYEKYGVSGTMMRYINKIAKPIGEWCEKEYPEREIYLVTFAYLFSIEPPVCKEWDHYVPLDESVLPCDNIYLFYCNIDYCFYHSLLDEKCEWNKKFKDSFFGWKSMFNERIMIWNYSANYPHYLYPFFNYASISDNYRFFAQNGVKYLLEHGSCEGEFVDFSELKTYIHSKLMWDTNADVHELFEEFVKHYYKQCAPQIFEYFSLLATRLQELDREHGYHLRVYYLPESMFDYKNFPLEFIYKLFSCFEKAKSIAEEETDDALRECLLKRVTRGYISAKYLLLMNYDKYGIDGKSNFETQFLKDCRYCGIEKYKEDWQPGDKIPNLIKESENGKVLDY